MIFKYAHLSLGLNNVSIIGFAENVRKRRAPLSYTDGDMDSQRQQDQHKSRYVPHIICVSGLGTKMSVLFACLIKRVSKLPLYQLVIILSSADVLCKQFGRPPVKYFTDRPKAVLLLWIFYVFSVFRLLCLCARLFMCALRSPAEKGLTSWLSLWCQAVSLSLSHWYPGSGVVLDCIDS